MPPVIYVIDSTHTEIERPQVKLYSGL